MTRSVRRPVVLKFGGSTLADPARVVARLRAERARGGRVVVVASARPGVTDRLRAAIDRPRDRRGHRRLLTELRHEHPTLPPAGRAVLRRLRRLLGALERGRAADPAVADRLLSQGERLSAHWLSALLTEAGIPSVAVEADHLGLLTDNAYGASRILLSASRRPVRSGLDRVLRGGRVPIVTGFIGRSLEGRVATLGRGGSDYTASALGAILGASRVELLKGRVAVLTADPQAVPRARRIPRLTYEEAEELAQFGATVLHPLSIEPARRSGFELHVRSLLRPSVRTVIGPGPGGRRLRALSLLAPLALLRLRVPGGRGRPGVIAEVSRSLLESGINLVALFTSSGVLSVVVEPSRSAEVRRRLEEFAAEDRATVEPVEDVDLITAIGHGILSDVERLPVPLLRRAEGLSATPRSLAVAVRNGSGPAALRSIHRVLVEQSPGGPSPARRPAAARALPPAGELVDPGRIRRAVNDPPLPRSPAHRADPSVEGSRLPTPPGSGRHRSESPGKVRGVEVDA